VNPYAGPTIYVPYCESGGDSSAPDAAMSRADDDDHERDDD
jgi:hypothetical protein